MPTIRKLVLDVLKPHEPNALEFAVNLAAAGIDMRIKHTVVEVDEKTESTILVIEGNDLAYEDINEAIKKMGASIHSIDEVEVESSDDITGNH